LVEDHASIGLVVPGPIRTCLLGLDLEAKALHLALPQELSAVCLTLRINVVLPLVEQAQLLGDVRRTAIPRLVSIVTSGEGIQIGAETITTAITGTTITTRHASILKLVEPGPIWSCLLGLDLEAEALHLALPQELSAVVLALRINVVPPLVEQAQLLGDIRWTAIPGLVSIVASGEGIQIGAEAETTTETTGQFEVPGPVGACLLGLDLEGEALHLALPQELGAVVLALRINVVPPLVEQAQLLGDVRWAAIPSLVSIVMGHEGAQMGGQRTHAHATVGLRGVRLLIHGLTLRGDPAWGRRAGLIRDGLTGITGITWSTWIHCVFKVLLVLQERTCYRINQ